MLKHKLIEVVLCLLAGYAATSEALTGLGSCPFVRPQTDFNVSASQGVWYEFTKYPIPSESLSKCINVQLQELENGTIVIVKTSTGKITGIQTGVTGKATLIGPGTLKISADGIAGVLGSTNVVVLDSEPSSYAVLFSCVQVPGFVHKRYASILTRERHPDGATINKAKKALTSNGLSVQSLANTDQLNCPVH